MDNRNKPTRPTLNRAIAIFHRATTFSPIAINPTIIERIGVSESQMADTVVFFRREHVYIAEPVDEAIAIWANALNGRTDWEGAVS